MTKWKYLALLLLPLFLPVYAAESPSSPRFDVGYPFAISSLPRISYEPILPTIKNPLKNAEKLEKLALCESGDRQIVIVDTNGLYSYHYLQFQLRTFRAYAEKYGLIPLELSDDKLRELIKDRDLQFATADKMLSEPGGWRHWYNCSKIIGLAP